MQFHVFNVGHGFCALLVADDGRVTLFDCGHDENTFRPSIYLPSQGIHAIDTFQLSHFDSDHVSDLHELRERAVIRAICRNISMSASAIALSKQAEGPLSRGMLAALEMHQWTGPVVTAPATSGLEMVTFCNEYPTFVDTNNLSMVTFVHFGKFNAVIPGDLEELGWLELLRSQAVRQHLARTNVFIASHHGRENGYCAQVFSYCSPEIVVISDTNKQYSSQEHCYDTHASGVMFANGIRRKVLTTRCDGHISFYADMNGARVETSNSLPALRRPGSLFAYATGRP